MDNNSKYCENSSSSRNEERTEVLIVQLLQEVFTLCEVWNYSQYFQSTKFFLKMAPSNNKRLFVLLRGHIIPWRSSITDTWYRWMISIVSTISAMNLISRYWCGSSNNNSHCGSKWDLCSNWCYHCFFDENSPACMLTCWLNVSLKKFAREMEVLKEITFLDLRG